MTVVAVMFVINEDLLLWPMEDWIGFVLLWLALSETGEDTGFVWSVLTPLTGEKARGKQLGHTVRCRPAGNIGCRWPVHFSKYNLNTGYEEFKNEEVFYCHGSGHSAVHRFGRDGSGVHLICRPSPVLPPMANRRTGFRHQPLLASRSWVLCRVLTSC
ncbi:hypothetical protein RAA17_12475 [Komagataeibacter rhaeticus]|nr:hypothetical protein [Komagataeibacter rhaeticus]